MQLFRPNYRRRSWGTGIISRPSTLQSYVEYILANISVTSSGSFGVSLRYGEAGDGGYFSTCRQGDALRSFPSLMQSPPYTNHLDRGLKGV